MERVRPDAQESTPFGVLLRRHRQAAGLTQEEMAERAGLTAQAITAIERGVRRRPYKETVRALADALGLVGTNRAAFEAAARQPDQATRALPSPPPERDNATPVVGRVGELALVEQHCRGEGPPVLLLAGEPGIGKSRLLQEVVQRAVAGGWQVLQGGCQRRGGQEPYAPLLEALERHIQRLAPAPRRESLQGCAWLVRVLPELALEPIEPLPAWTVPPEQERRLVFKAVQRYLANVAGPSGTLLVLDDLQWAGGDALDLLASLARAAAEGHLRLVGAYRDTEVPRDAPLAVTLATLAEAELVVQRTLEPLSAAEVGQLLDQLVPGVDEAGGALREQVAQRTGGVPFFVISCAQALRPEGGTWQGADAVPWTVAQSVRQRVAALSTQAQGVLGVAAVLGRVVQPALVAAVAAQSEDDILGALEAAHRLRLLEEREGAYQFAHDLVREVVEADVGPARRLALHRRAGEALEQEPGKAAVALLAYHYACSDARDKAVFYLERAGDQAEAQFAHTTAATYYGELVGRLESMGGLPEAARVREKLGAVLSMEARYQEALAALEPAADSYQLAGDLERLGRVTAQIGHIHCERGTPGQGLARVQSLLGRLQADSPSRSLALMYVALARLLKYTNQLSAALLAAERATDLARALGDTHMLAIAEERCADGLEGLGRIGEARAVLQDAVPHAEAANELQCLAKIFNSLAHLYLHQGEFQTSMHYINRALALAERIGDARNVVFDLMHRGYILFCSGEWGQARTEAERAASLCHQIGTFYVSGHPFMVLGFVCYAEGYWAEAVTHLEHSVAVADARAPEALVMAQSVLAEIDLLEGRPAAARSRVVTLLERCGPQNCDNAYLLPKLAWAHLELGELAQAEAVAAQAVRFAQEIEDFINLVEAVRVQALVLMAQHRWAEAEMALAGVLPETKRRCYPWGEARVLDTYRLLDTRAGAVGPARERMEAALALYKRLGARKDVERIEQELASLGSPQIQPATNVEN